MHFLRSAFLAIGLLGLSAGAVACGGSEKSGDTTATANPCGDSAANPCGDTATDTANPCGDMGGDDMNPCGDEANPCGDNPCGDEANPCGDNPCGDW